MEEGGTIVLRLLQIPPSGCFGFVENVNAAVYERTRSFHYSDEPIPGLPKTWCFQITRESKRYCMTLSSCIYIYIALNIEKLCLFSVEYRRSYNRVNGTVPKVDDNVVVHSVWSFNPTLCVRKQTDFKILAGC